ncbi:hypothetical protein KAJ27_05420 [bacterium]|nr:hypothetical protein [bacterium]
MKLVFTKRFLIIVLIFNLLLPLLANNNELIVQASNSLVRMDFSKTEELLEKVDYSLIKNDQIKAFYFFIFGKLYYYRMDYSRGIRYMKKSVVFNSGYREWAVYYCVLMSFMREDFKAIDELLKRYRVDLKDFKIKKSIDFISRSIKERK